MSDFPRKLVRGESLDGIDTASWNAYYDTWRKFNQSQDGGNGPGQSAGANALKMEVFNASGADIAADFPVLSITGPSYNADDRAEVVREGITLEGDTPDGSTTVNDICIVQGPIVNGESRQAVVNGATWVQVNWTDAGHSYAQPESGNDTRLKSGNDGLQVLWRESGLGIVWALVWVRPNLSPIQDTLKGTVQSVVAAGAASNTYRIFVLKTSAPAPVPLPTGTPPLTGTIYVADPDNKGGAVTAGDPIFAIRRVAVDTYNPGGGAVDVDWEYLPFVAGSVPTLNVQLYNNVKNRSDTSVKVKLLKADLTDAGLTEVDCYDLHGEFSSGLSESVKGRATLVRDAFTGATRLEFTHLQGPAAWVCATLDENMGATSTGEAKATVNSYHGLDWSNEDPADGSGDVTVLPCSGMHENLQSGDKVVAVLKDPDTDPIEYLIVEVNGSAAYGKFGVTDGVISGKSGSSLGAGTVSVWQTTAAGSISDSGTNETWYNYAEATIAAGQEVQAKPVKSTDGSTIWIIDWEEC